MRALVTGAAGFVGTHLVHSLLGDGVEVWAGTPEPTPPEGDPRVCWIGLDVTDSDSVRHAVGAARPDHVYHLAGQASVASSFRDSVGTWDVNATGTLRIVDALRPGTRLLLASSAEVYGRVPEEAQPIAEDRPLRPANPYAASKAAAEMVCMAAGARGVEAVIARSFNHTGPGQDERFALASFARQLAAMPAGGGTLKVGSLEARRDLLDVRDVVRAYRRLADRGLAGMAYNVCAGRALSIGEALGLLIAGAGIPVQVEVDPSRVRPVDVPLLLGDASRIHALGWRPEIPMEQTLSDLLEAQREALG